MPWCATCDRFLSPSTVRADGSCPACTRPVDPGRAHRPESVDGELAVDRAPSRPAPLAPVPAGVDADEEAPPIPWHLWLLLAALAVYLGYRAFEGLEWLFGF